MKQYLDNLRWRYATKKFDPSKKLSAEQLDTLLEAARLSASSYGLQPYKFVVVTNPEIRAKIREHAWGQPQVTDASHLVVICAYRSLDARHVDHYIAEIAKTRGMTVESLSGFRDMLLGGIQGRSPQQNVDWSKRQSYIALGFLLSAAANMQVDACPMEGFDPTHVDVDLHLAEHNLTSVTMCPLGLRAPDDPAAEYKKVRFPKEELFIFKN